jgi:hypothetical protein
VAPPPPQNPKCCHPHAAKPEYAATTTTTKPEYAGSTHIAQPEYATSTTIHIAMAPASVPTLPLAPAPLAFYLDAWHQQHCQRLCDNSISALANTPSKLARTSKAAILPERKQKVLPGKHNSLISQQNCHNSSSN